MYCQQVSNSRLDFIQAEIDPQTTKPVLDFQLHRFSRKECQDFAEWTNTLINEDLYKAAAKRNIKAVKALWEHDSKLGHAPLFISVAHEAEFYKKEIQDRINNERTICKWDANYFTDNYYQIKDYQGIYVPYSPLPAQRIWRRIRSDLNAKALPIKQFDLKGRQQGDTTEKVGLLLQRLNFFPDVDCLIASKQDKDTGIMSLKLINALDRLPFWLRVFYESFETGAGYRFDNGSFIDLGWGTQEYLGKGQTPTTCHLSEIASFKYPKSAIENALFRAMHESEWLLQFLEGTAETRDDWFHKKVKEIISSMERGVTSWYFTFIPWFFRRDLYPTDTYVKARADAFASWIPKPETIAMAEVARNSVISWKYSREELGSNWRMDREQMFYYELERDQAESEERLAEFLSQMPTTVDEAFQHAGKTLYKTSLIEFYDRTARSIIPEVYKLRGDISEVSPQYWPEPDEILEGEEAKTIRVTCNWNPSIPASVFELVRIKFDGWDKFDPVNKFIIWFHPKRGEDYSQAVDTSDGLGRNISDDAIININRIGTAEARDRQCLEFASPEIPLGSMWPFVLVSATYYSSPSNVQILSAIECNKGYELQNALIQRGWWNLYKRLDESSPYQDESKVQKYGFWTDRGSRPALIGHFHTFFIGQHYEIYSPLLIGETRDLEKVRRPNAELGFASDKILGKKDNRILAAAINLFASHRREIAGHERKTWEERRRLDEDIVDIKTFSGLSYEKDFDEDMVIASLGEEDSDNDFKEGFYY